MKRIFAIALLFLGWNVTAQETVDSVKIKEVLVIAAIAEADFAQSRVRIDSMALASGLFQTLAELIARNTPVFIKSYGRGSAATASFRGTAASHAPVLWNGMPIHSPLRGMADVSLLPVLFTDELMLYSGAGALQETGGALGGALYLGNRAEWHLNNRIQLLSEQASFGSSVYMGRLQLGQGNFRSVTKLVYDASTNQYPFYNVGVVPARTDTLRNGAYSKWGVLQEFYLRLGDSHQGSARFWYQESDRDLPPLMTFEGAHRTEQQTDQQIRGLAEFKNFGRRFNYQLSTGFSYLNLAYFLSTGPMHFVNANSISEELSSFHQARFVATFTPRTTLHGVFGVQQHRVTVDNLVQKTGFTVHQSHAESMLRLQQEVNSRLGWYALVRGAWYDDGKLPLVPSAGVHYSLNPRHSYQLKANIARNYHRPSLNDLYWLPGGNPNLLPEEGWLADIALRHATHDAITFTQQLTLFYARIHHWILWQPSPRGAWYWEAANLREVLSRGAEYHMNGRFSVASFKLQYSGNVAITVTTHQDEVSNSDLSRGKQLIYVPKITGNFFTALQRWDWTLKTDISYTGKRFTQSSHINTLFEHVLTPFWLTSVSLERNFTVKTLQLTGRGKIDNLLNVHHQQMLWRPMPGRHYAISLSIGGIW